MHALTWPQYGSPASLICSNHQGGNTLQVSAKARRRQSRSLSAPAGGSAPVELLLLAPLPHRCRACTVQSTTQVAPASSQLSMIRVDHSCCPSLPSAGFVCISADGPPGAPDPVFLCFTNRAACCAAAGGAMGEFAPIAAHYAQHLQVGLSQQPVATLSPPSCSPCRWRRRCLR